MFNQSWRPLLLAFLVAGVASAEETATPLTWQDCVRLAAQRNPDLLSAQRAMEASHAQYHGSFSAFFPQLSLTNSYTDSSQSGGGTVINGVVSGTSRANSGLWQAQANTSLSVINPTAWATIRSNSALFDQSQANFRVSATTVLLNLYKSYAGLLYAQEQGHVAQDIYTLWKTNASMIGLRYDSGRESKGNRMRTDADLLQAQSGLAQAGRDLRVAQESLGQVLGEDHFRTLVVTGTWSVAALSPEPPDLDELINREPRILAQSALVRQNRAMLQSSRSTLLPTLSLNYNRGWQGDSEFPTTPSWVFSGVAALPLFGGGPTAVFYASSAAKRNLEKAELDLRSLRNQVRTDILSAWSAYAQAQEQVQVQKAYLDSGRQRREESDVRYRSGLMSYEEWQLVINDLVNFEKSYLKSEQSLILAEAQWRFARGEELAQR